MEYKHERVGELLVRNGVITEAQLDATLERQGHTNARLGDLLIEDLLATEDQVAAALAEQRDLDLVNLSAVQLDRFGEALRLMPASVLERHTFLPIGFDEEGQLILAMADPLDIEAIDEARLITGLQIRPVVASASAIRTAIARYAVDTDALVDLDATETDVPSYISPEPGNEVPIVRLVSKILIDAVGESASDIHVEPQEDRIRVRYRIDGELHEVMNLPSSALKRVVARIKIMADMDITEHRRPQDGRIATQLGGRRLDLRVATTPTPLGESVAIRVLNSDVRFLELCELGLSEPNMRRFSVMLNKPHGAILIAGPTGSGKTTTLYAALNELNETSRKIMTIEDPVEYRVPGVTQIALNRRIDLTFATGLRAILRSDPDIVMVGEVRDAETAGIAMRAALTGHLMLTSIHTNDAPSVLTRLTDMKVERYVTSAAVIGVVSQRLVRKLCPSCRKATVPDPDRLVQAGFNSELASEMRVFEPVGCPACRGTGYKGRIGVFEVMPIDDEMVELFHAGASLSRIRKQALLSGMISLRDDALAKLASGVTSLQEVERILM